jgi:serine/threonine protein kinase
VNTLDRYEILGELGRGAISIVYDARDLLTGDPVALKLIESSLCPPPTSAAERLRFLTESMPGWRLRDPNIVRVYDAGDSDGRLYVAMERLKGYTLRRVLDESPLPGVSRSLRMAAEFASGLAHAHERGVVHRYLKPSNIFVLAHGHAKITDFGMAPLRGAALASPNHAACLSYMSPEEIRCDEAIDGRSDIFSLGVVLYEMLTGERPFSGDSPDDIMRNVLEAELPLPSEMNADLPPMVDLLIWSMLAKSRHSRAPSAGILARRLRRLREEIDGALAAPARDEEVSAAAEAPDERASSHVVLTLVHPGDERAPSDDNLVEAFRELGEEADAALAAHAPDEEVSRAAEAMDERASDHVVLTLVHQEGDRASSADNLVHAFRELGEEADASLAAHALDQKVSAAAEAMDERASDHVVLAPGHRGTLQRTKLPTYALTVLILAVAGSAFLWQWRHFPEPPAASSAVARDVPTPPLVSKPSLPEEARLAASVPERNEPAVAPEALVPDRSPVAVSAPEPEKRTTKAPAAKPSGSPAPARKAQPSVAALAAAAPSPAKTATLVFDVLPWGEIYINGKLRGTTPPVNTVALPPGRHRIEVRNSARPPYISYTTLEPGDVRPIRYHFE